MAIERNVDIGCIKNACIHIDEDTFLALNVCIAKPGDINIGQHCLIASHSGIYANNHNYTDSLSPIKQQGVTCQGIVIEDDCWLGHEV